MKRTFCLLILVIALGSGAFAQGSAAAYLNYLPQDIRAELFSKGTIGDMGGTLEELKLWRSSPLAQDVGAAFNGRESTIAAESWFILPKPSYGSEAERDLKIFRSFTSFTTMKGLLVYSESLKKMETFIYDSYRVDSLENKRRLADPGETETPTQASYFLYQKEEQTGDVYSEMHFLSHGNWFEVSLENRTPMKYLLFTLVQPRELKTIFYIIPTDDKLLLYGATVARTPTFLGIEKLKRSSFFNRMKALASWIQHNLESTN